MAGKYTPAQKKATEKYLKNSVDDLHVYLPKGKKEIIKSHAEARGESTNAFISRAIDETMERDADN